MPTTYDAICNTSLYNTPPDRGGHIRTVLYSILGDLTQNWACTNLYFIRSFSGQRAGSSTAGRNYDGKTLLGLHALQG